MLQIEGSGSHPVLVTFAMTFPLSGTLSSLFPCETHTRLHPGAWDQNAQLQALLGGSGFDAGALESTLFGDVKAGGGTLTLAQQLMIKNTQSLTLQRSRVHLGHFLTSQPFPAIHPELLRVSVQQACTELYVQGSHVSDTAFGRKSTRWSMSRLAQKAKQVLLLQSNPSAELPSRTVWAALFNDHNRRPRSDDLKLPSTPITDSLRSEFSEIVGDATSAQLRAAWNRFQKFENARPDNKAKQMFDRLGIQVYYKPVSGHQQEFVSLANYSLGEIDDSYLVQCIRMVLKQLDTETRRYKNGHLSKGWYSVHDVALACTMRLPEAHIRAPGSFEASSWNDVEALCAKIVALGESCLTIVWDPRTKDLPFSQRLMRRGWDVSHKRRRSERQSDYDSDDETTDDEDTSLAAEEIAKIWQQVLELFPDNPTHQAIHTFLSSSVGDILDDVEARFNEGGDELASCAMSRRIMEFLPSEFDGVWDSRLKNSHLKELMLESVKEAATTGVLGLGVEAEQCREHVAGLRDEGKIEEAWRCARHFFLMSLWSCRRNTFIGFILQR